MSYVSRRLPCVLKYAREAQTDRHADTHLKIHSDTDPQFHMCANAPRAPAITKNSQTSHPGCHHLPFLLHGLSVCLSVLNPSFPHYIYSRPVGKTTRGEESSKSRFWYLNFATLHATHANNYPPALVSIFVLRDHIEKIARIFVDIIAKHPRLEIAPKDHIVRRLYINVQQISMRRSRGGEDIRKCRG